MLLAALVLLAACSAGAAEQVLRPLEVAAALDSLDQASAALAAAAAARQPGQSARPQPTTPPAAAAAPAPPSAPARAALIVVDTQPCFMPGGSLAVPDGDEVVPVINSLLANSSVPWELVVFTQDWHPPAHVSFASTYQSDAAKSFLVRPPAGAAAEGVRAGCALRAPRRRIAAAADAHATARAARPPAPTTACLRRRP